MRERQVTAWAEAIDAALETLGGVAAGILQTVVTSVVSGATVEYVREGQAQTMIYVVDETS